MLLRALLVIAGLFLLSGPVVAQSEAELSPAEMERYGALTDQATAIADRYIILEGRHRAAPNETEIRRAIALYDEALRIHDGRYGVWWMRGKLFQALGQEREAFISFRRAYALEPNSQQVINEMTIHAMEVGEFDFAFAAVQQGLTVFPNDLPLRARLALVQLLRGHPAEAIAAADRALEIAPNDGISRLIKRLAEEVRDGRRPQPRSMRDLTG
ncbi:hypothetical protein [Terricaulis sp.]|uniref:hypothetical protein n=1 Tax=Terricaulis sp. TaxID=2768686 RepID=UPI002AC480F9|nr:hypothetical protein [Terricaulis sp.]MDZ4691434.1 hypothetical protein [Terricaulis sp.]